MNDAKVYTFYGDSTDMLRDQIKDLIDRGGTVSTLSIAYGPPPNRDRNTWIALVICEWPNGVPRG